MCVRAVMFFFFKQKTAYDMRISDWSSDVCSSDLIAGKTTAQTTNQRSIADGGVEIWSKAAREDCPESEAGSAGSLGERNAGEKRSEEHTSELQSLMRISYAVFCFKKTISNKTQSYNSAKTKHTELNNNQQGS